MRAAATALVAGMRAMTAPAVGVGCRKLLLTWRERQDKKRGIDLPCTDPAISLGVATAVPTIPSARAVPSVTALDPTRA